VRKTATVGNLALAGYDDIFNAGTLRNGETIAEIALAELHAPDCHPFRVNDDESMTRLAESVREYGVREPGLARTRSEGGYELLCGNRRKRACEIVGLATMPIIVRELNDDLAVIAMVDSNLQQRDKILPSEKAWAYKMKMDALNHSGIKGDKHSCDIMAERTGEEKTKIFRYIRLTELIEALLDKVDAREMALTPAVEISFLSYEEQRIVAECMARHEVKPSLSQAVRLKKMKQAGTLRSEAIDSILAEEKKTDRTAPTSGAHYRKFFPPDYSAKQIETVIIGLLKEWKARAAV
jgi:ParB family chromosome partitioning protein